MLHEADKDRLVHMLDAAECAIQFSKDSCLDALEDNIQLQFSLIRCLEIIGEAASRVSEDLRTKNEQIPWAKMVGTRNRLIHAYFNVDVEVIRHTVSEELPFLIREIESLLAET